MVSVDRFWTKMCLNSIIHPLRYRFWHPCPSSDAARKGLQTYATLNSFTALEKWMCSFIRSFSVPETWWELWSHRPIVSFSLLHCGTKSPFPLWGSVKRSRPQFRPVFRTLLEVSGDGGVFQLGGGDTILTRRQMVLGKRVPHRKRITW